MKILKLSAENFKRISVVEIKPDGNLVQITGKNGSGKTSCLDAIWCTLEGATHLQSVPIRKGADKATIQLTLGGDKVELIATRTIRARKDGPGFNTTLTVESADGFRAPSPQEAMDKLMGRITMDPLAFTREKPKAQFDILRAFVKDIDFDDIAARNKSDFDKRTEANRDAKRARTAAEMVHVPDSIDAETQPVDEAALTAELAGAGEYNASIERDAAARAKAVKDAQELEDEAEGMLDPDALVGLRNHTALPFDRRSDELGKEIHRLELLLKDAKQRLEDNIAERTVAQTDAERKEREEAARKMRDSLDLRAWLDRAAPLSPKVDTEALTVKITEARWTNQAIRSRDERAKHIAEAERLEATSLNLTTAMEGRDKMKADAIAAAELPVPGLGFGDGLVTIDGLPFDQASDAQQLRTSIAIAIATAGTLRVIRVRDGSLLDDEGLQLLAEMADKADMQVWVESVSNGEKVGFTLEDGHLAGHPPPTEPVSAAKGKEPKKQTAAGNLL
jgi:energy-coupling factor transporter ATP-binding protein EcfA2